jgi:NAD(P)H-hydrate epimerase
VTTAVLSLRLLRTWLRPRRSDAHKGDAGHVLVAGGAVGMTGAALLCAEAALRCGAGLVTLALPRRSWAAAARRARREVMTLPLPDVPSGGFHSAAAGRLIRFCAERRVTALALGPGLSVTPHTVRLVKRLLTALKVPVVLDADGLNAWTRAGLGRARAPLVVTPHPGEAARMLGTSASRVQADRPGALLRLCRRTGAVVLLKGRRTLISDGRRTCVNPTGNPGMATGGTGDALTGAVAALVGQATGEGRERLFRAAAVAAYVHGRAGDLAARRVTRIALTAGDLIDALPAAFRRTFGRGI